jgi:hypothetical protein
MTKENKTSKFSIRNSIFVIQIKKYLIGFPALGWIGPVRRSLASFHPEMA